MINPSNNLKKYYRTVLIDLAGYHEHADVVREDMVELQSLIKTYGGIDVVQIIQHRKKPDRNTFIGSGKMLELVEIVKTKKIQIIIINALVNSTVLFNITQKLWAVNPNIQVWDRIDLILNIFDKHAASAEAKLQIEIARMQHMGPSIYGLGGTVLSRQGGGIGTRGLGETNIELMKRHFRNQIKQKTEQLQKLTSHRNRQLLRRKELGLKTVSLIGYTNAGKTSLFNTLSGKKHVVKDALFVTLDSAVGEMHLPSSGVKIVLSDTIGFIQNLPSSLIEAFKSTLMESINADLLLHVIDIADKKMAEKIEIVERVIADLHLGDKKIMYVFNKIDDMEPDIELLRHIKKIYLDYEPEFISVKLGVGLDSLKRHIEAMLDLPEAEIPVKKTV